MTKNEIIARLEHCINNVECSECAYYLKINCGEELMKDAKEFIEKQHKKLVTNSVRGVR